MQVKARPFKATLEFIENRFGPAKLKTFLAEYSEFSIINETPDFDWLELNLFIRLSEKTDSYFGFGDLSLLYEIGVFSARQAFEKSHKLFKDITPLNFVQSGPALFASYYRVGRPEFEVLTDRKARLTIRDFCESKAVSKRIAAWLKEGITAAGAKHASVAESEPKDNTLSFCVEWEE